MTIPRLLILSSLMLVCLAAASAQSSPQNVPNSSQPTSTLSQNVEADLAFFPLSLEDLGTPSNPSPESIQSEQSGKTTAPVHTQSARTLGQNELMCLTLRTYRFARVSPDSDTTRFVGYSTCAPSARFQIKTAVDSQEINPR